MKKKEIIIDRSKWRTGDESSNQTGQGCTYLLNEEGFKCCLGFITQQTTKKGILDRCGPDDCDFSIPELNKKYVNHYDNTQLSSEAISINDDSLTTPQQKEKLLKELFKKHKSRYTLKFVGKYASQT